MAAIAAGRSRPLARLFMGPRVGATMLALGLVFSTAAAILVISLDRRARAAGAATAARAQQVPVAYVVMTTRDVAESSRIPADALAVKPFPAAYAPPGAAKTVEEVAG